MTPLAPRIATRAAQHSLPAGLVAALDLHLRAHSAGDRLDEVIDELERIRVEAGSPPLAAPIGQVLASQALLHVLSAERYQTVVDELRDLLAGRYGDAAGGDRPVRPASGRARLRRMRPRRRPCPTWRSCASSTHGVAASEEELLLLALFGEDAEPLLRSIRGRGREDSLEGGGVDASRAERIREIVRIVQDSGVGEVTIEDAGLRVTVRRTPEPAEGRRRAAGAPSVEEEQIAAAGRRRRRTTGLIRVEAPMVGTFYRAPSPGAPPFVEEGDAVGVGQTLCILEAMKLMNEVKAEREGIVRRIHPENAQPVEYGAAAVRARAAQRPPAGL